MIAQLILTISPNGALQAELPGRNGARQIIPISDHQAASQLRHLLKDRLLELAVEAHIATQQRTNGLSYDENLEKLLHATHQANLAKKRHVTNQHKVPHTVDPDDLGL